jgi:hypothetical protein
MPETLTMLEKQDCADFSPNGRFGLAVLIQAGILGVKNSCAFKRQAYIMQPSVVLLY